MNIINNKYPDTPLSLLTIYQSDYNITTLDQLVSIYWLPVYMSYQQPGLDSENAMDLTQSFFCDKILKGELFKKYNPNISSLRCFLRTASFRYYHNYKRDNFNKIQYEYIASEDIDNNCISNESKPNEIFDISWSLTIIELAANMCEKYYSEKLLQPKYWNAFYLRVLRPLLTTTNIPPLTFVTAECNFNTITHTSTISLLRSVHFLWGRSHL